MPNKATVSGELVDATLTPVAGGKVVAELSGSDIFDEGVRIVTQKVEATTDADGRWSMDLIVNGEGQGGTTTWSVTIYNQYAVSVHTVKALFIPVNAAITLASLESTSAANIAAAKDASKSRVLIVQDMAEYAALPANQRRDNDIVIVRPVV